MADVTLAAQAVEDAPLAYPIPGAAELLLKLLTADYDGTGAGGPFVPCVQITLADGTVAGTFPLQTTVAAGSSVDVSWFPNGGMKTAAASKFGSSLLGTFAQGTGSPLTTSRSTILWDNPPDVLIGTDIALDVADTDVIISTAGWYSFMFAWQLTGFDATSNGTIQMLFATNNLPNFGWFGTLGSNQIDTCQVNGAIDASDQWGVLTTPAVNLGVMTSPPLIAPVGQLVTGYAGTAPAFGTFCNLVVLREA